MFTVCRMLVQHVLYTFIHALGRGRVKMEGERGRREGGRREGGNEKWRGLEWRERRMDGGRDGKEEAEG